MTTHSVTTGVCWHRDNAEWNKNENILYIFSFIYKYCTDKLAALLGATEIIKKLSIFKEETVSENLERRKNCMSTVG